VGGVTDSLTVHEAAALLGVSVRRVRQLCEQGRLVARKHGPVWLIDRASVVARAKRRA